MQAPGLILVGNVLIASLLSACASSPAIPPSLQGEVDTTLDFELLKQSPNSYQGRVVVLGGDVLSAKRTAEGTRIEILQLPLDRNQEPVTDRMSSQGRFLAFRKQFLDPATLPAGARVTIVGQVTHAITMPLDEIDYTYPTLDIKNIKVWPEREAYPYWYGPHYWGPYWHPYWGPYWHRHPYWW